MGFEGGISSITQLGKSVELSRELVAAPCWVFVCASVPTGQNSVPFPPDRELASKGVRLLRHHAARLLKVNTNAKHLVL